MITRLAVRRPVAASMLFVAVVLLGSISFTRLPIDLLPDISYPRLVIYTSYPAVAPLEVERQITEPIERQVASVPGVEKVSSVSRDGVSLVTLRFAWGTDMDFATLNTRERLDNARQALPENVARPQILPVDPDSEPIMAVSVAGSDLWNTKQLAEDVLRRRLEQLDGVAQAAVTGGLEREILVEVDPDRLEAYRLSIRDVADAIDAANHQATGGTILEGRSRYPLRTLGEFRNVAEIEGVVVAEQQAGASGNRIVYLRDVARVVDGFADREEIARYNGREAVGLLVFKESGANTVQVARRVDEVLGLLRQEFEGLSLDVPYSQAGFISDSISNVTSALVLGGVLAFLVLFLFLRNPRYPVTVAIAIPISIVGTFGLMHASGVSLNIMSLGGLALGVGMLVDNSIIVIENIFRHRGEGRSAVDAASEGAREVAGAITASTLTTIAVFGPIVSVEGVAGELFRDLSLAVAFSLATSLAVALTLLPTMAARFRLGDAEEPASLRPLRPAPRPRGLFLNVVWAVRVVWRFPFWLLRHAAIWAAALLRFWWDGLGAMGHLVFGPPLAAFDREFERFTRWYDRALAWSLERRGAVLAAAFGGLVGAAALGWGLDRDLLPRVDQGAFELRVELPEETALARTNEVAGLIEGVLLADPDVEAVFAHVGRDVRAYTSEDASGLHTAEFRVRLREGTPTGPVLDRLREPLTRAVPDGAVAIGAGQATALGQLLGGSDADIGVRVRGQELDAAIRHAADLARSLGQVDRITNVRLGTERGQPQFAVDILREEAARYGLRPSEVAEAIEHGMRGLQATEFVSFDRKVPVVVRLPDALRYDRATLDRLHVAGVPIRELTSVEATVGPAEVHREEQARVVTVHADVARGGLDDALAAVEAVLAASPAPNGLRVEVGGENEEMRRSFRDLALAFLLALALVYMILAAQFESFVYPFTILAAVPLALIGAIGALALAGEGLNTMSLIGMVILIGIVVNDAIVKVDFIVQARKKGTEVHAAIIQAGLARLRPIVMTTVTTVLGLTPMALGFGRGADLRAPLAIAVIGGLTVATALTLIVVPIIFSLVEELRLTLAGQRSGTAGHAPVDHKDASTAVPLAMSRTGSSP